MRSVMAGFDRSIFIPASTNFPPISPAISRLDQPSIFSPVRLDFTATEPLRFKARKAPATVSMTLSIGTMSPGLNTSEIRLEREMNWDALDASQTRACAWTNSKDSINCVASCRKRPGCHPIPMTTEFDMVGSLLLRARLCCYAAHTSP